MVAGLSKTQAQGPYILRAHWDFNNIIGSTLPDVSGNGHNGVIVGCTNVPGCDGVTDHALRFQPGQYVQIPGSQDFCSNEWTIHAVVRVNGFNKNPATCQWNTILSHDNPRGMNTYYSIDVGNSPTYSSSCTGPANTGEVFSASLGGTSVPAIGSGVGITAGQWYCLTIVNRPAGALQKLEFYVNGILVSSAGYTWPNVFSAPCPLLDLLLGKGDFGGGNFTWFDGEIDDLWMYENAMYPSDFSKYLPPCPCGSGPGTPCSVDDIQFSGALSAPYVRSYTPTVTPSGNWVHWSVNGTMVSSLPSTSPFIYTFPSSGSYIICATAYDPTTGTDCDQKCFETCIGGTGYRSSPTGTGSIPGKGSIHPTVGELRPNPVESSLIVPIKEYSGPVHVSISTVDGKKLLTDEFDLAKGQGQVELPTRTLAPGTYFVEIGLETGLIRRKFTKL
ncbi:MAG: T9SS type A sorting domain-containing protein [Bacteroidetes bacterium]|nr:T9SS type A sorting domain-containing protein [Bacteroidota bacterium]